MKLYLLRHGHSPSVSQAGVKSDALRPLSQEGRRDIERISRELLRRGALPALVLHSPLTRAVESAGLAGAILKPARGLEMFSPLQNELPAQELMDRLAERCRLIEEILLIGHQPQLGDLAAHLTGELRELRPAGLIAVEATESRFLWSCHPDEL